MKRKIQLQDLPIAAQAGLSPEQRTYLDEFTFYWVEGEALVEAHGGVGRSRVAITDTDCRSYTPRKRARTRPLGSGRISSKDSL